MQTFALPLLEFRRLLKEHGFTPSKTRGQNFMFDKNLSDSIARDAQVDSSKTILEIGTGCGYLTAALAQRAGHILTCEIDQRLQNIAKQVLINFANIDYWHGNVLDAKAKLNPMLVRKLHAIAPFEVVANLPYSIAGPLLANLFLLQPVIPQLVFTVQKELGERLLAPAGSSNRGPLTLVAQLYYQMKILRQIPPQVFWPKPKVDSVLVRCTRYSRPLAANLEKTYQTLVRASFQQRRKKIKKSLKNQLPSHSGLSLDLLESLGERRPEDLEVKDFLALAGKGSLTP